MVEHEAVKVIKNVRNDRIRNEEGDTKVETPYPKRVKPVVALEDKSMIDFTSFAFLPFFETVVITTTKTTETTNTKTPMMAAQKRGLTNQRREATPASFNIFLRFPDLSDSS